MPRERWGSRLGLILAMAGNAVGLGNFLRFPVQAVANGGGTFMIPYFVALVLVGIPLVWVEMGLGRHGGQRGHGSLPGMLDGLWKHPAAKYLGVLGLFIPFGLLVYYCYVESWTLAWTVYALTGATRSLDEAGMRAFLVSYQTRADPAQHAAWAPFLFFALTLALNFWIVGRGIDKGIERLAKVAMPALFLFAVVLVVRVLTLGPREVAGATASPAVGLSFMYTPDWNALLTPRTWLAAAGQIFFTLSIGAGSVAAYASYLRREDDLALSGLTAAATNETAEVVLGGSLAIPAVVTFFGVSGAMAIARGGPFDLGFVAMPLVFNRLPGGPVISAAAGGMWFGLLFFAGITSSVAMATPAISFLQERFAWPRRKAVWTLAALAAGLGLGQVVWYTRGFLAEWDYWIGTLGLVVCALVEVVVFVWIFGPARAWTEITDGAAIRVPRFFRFVITWITPAFLVALLAWWSWQDLVPTLLLRGRPADEVGVRWASRAVMVALGLGQLWLIRTAWRRQDGVRT